MNDYDLTQMIIENDRRNMWRFETLLISLLVAEGISYQAAVQKVEKISVAINGGGGVAGVEEMMENDSEDSRPR